MYLHRIWPYLLALTAILFCALSGTDWFTSLTVVSGVACVSLIAVGKRLGYLVGLVSSVTYAWVAWQNGLFGEVGLNLLFYVPTGIIGYFLWQRNETEGRVVMRRLEGRQRWWLITGTLLATCLLGVLLQLIPGQNSPFVDAATNVLSVIATLLMMWRFAEQWWLYVTLNILTVSLWIMRYLADGFAADSMIFLWLIYLVNSIFGFLVWSKGARTQDAVEG